MNLEIDIDARELKRAFNRAPIVVTRELQDWTEETAALSERVAKTEEVPVDRGELQNSIRMSIYRLSARVRAHKKYAQWVIKGREPGKMPPFKKGTPLNKWAERKGINPFLVARKIAREGTKPNPFMKRTYDKVEPIAYRNGRETLSRIVRGI